VLNSTTLAAQRVRERFPEDGQHLHDRAKITAVGDQSRPLLGKQGDIIR
jgi:hypothetical protein